LYNPNKNVYINEFSTKRKKDTNDDEIHEFEIIDYKMFYFDKNIGSCFQSIKRIETNPFFSIKVENKIENLQGSFNFVDNFLSKSTKSEIYTDKEFNHYNLLEIKFSDNILKRLKKNYQRLIKNKFKKNLYESNLYKPIFPLDLTLVEFIFKDGHDYRYDNFFIKADGSLVFLIKTKGYFLIYDKDLKTTVNFEIGIYVKAESYIIYNYEYNFIKNLHVKLEDYNKNKKILIVCFISIINIW
jgi:hypothetical protein